MALADARFTDLGSGRFLCKEADAIEFGHWHPELRDAPLRIWHSKVRATVAGDLTHGRGDALPAITITSPASVPRPPGAKRVQRRLNEKKVLTEHGLAALGRPGKYSKRCPGQLCRDTVVWNAVWRCAGTQCCDASQKPSKGLHCDVKVAYSATCQQVKDGVVQIDVSGHRSGSSLHSAAKAWCPQSLARARLAHSADSQAELQRSRGTAHAADVAVVMCEQDAADAVGVDQKRALVADAMDAATQYSVAQREASSPDRRPRTNALRDSVIVRMRCGADALKIYSEFPRAPSQEWVRHVHIDSWLFSSQVASQGVAPSVLHFLLIELPYACRYKRQWTTFASARGQTYHSLTRCMSCARRSLQTVTR